jgi:hypothetical protein
MIPAFNRAGNLPPGLHRETGKNSRYALGEIGIENGYCKDFERP